MTLTLSEIIKIQNQDNEQDLNFGKKGIMNTLTIDSNNQSQIIDTKLNINRNNLRRFLHQSTFSKMRK